MPRLISSYTVAESEANGVKHPSAFRWESIGSAPNEQRVAKNEMLMKPQINTSIRAHGTSFGKNIPEGKLWQDSGRELHDGTNRTSLPNTEKPSRRGERKVVDLNAMNLAMNGSTPVSCRRPCIDTVSRGDSKKLKEELSPSLRREVPLDGTPLCSYFKKLDSIPITDDDNSESINSVVVHQGNTRNEKSNGRNKRTVPPSTTPQTNTQDEAVEVSYKKNRREAHFRRAGGGTDRADIKGEPVHRRETHRRNKNREVAETVERDVLQLNTIASPLTTCEAVKREGETLHQPSTDDNDHLSEQCVEVKSTTKASTEPTNCSISFQGKIYSVCLRAVRTALNLAASGVGLPSVAPQTNRTISVTPPPPFEHVVTRKDVNDNFSSVDTYMDSLRSGRNETESSDNSTMATPKGRCNTSHSSLSSMVPQDIPAAMAPFTSAACSSPEWCPEYLESPHASQLHHHPMTFSRKAATPIQPDGPIIHTPKVSPPDPLLTKCTPSAQKSNSDGPSEKNTQNEKDSNNNKDVISAEGLSPLSIVQLWRLCFLLSCGGVNMSNNTSYCPKGENSIIMGTSPRMEPLHFSDDSSCDESFAVVRPSSAISPCLPFSTPQRDSQQVAPIHLKETRPLTTVPQEETSITGGEKTYSASHGTVLSPEGQLNGNCESAAADEKSLPTPTNHQVQNSLPSHSDLHSSHFHQRDCPCISASTSCHLPFYKDDSSYTNGDHHLFTPPMWRTPMQGSPTCFLSSPQSHNGIPSVPSESRSFHGADSYLNHLHSSHRIHPNGTLQPVLTPNIPQSFPTASSSPEMPAWNGQNSIPTSCYGNGFDTNTYGPTETVEDQFYWVNPEQLRNAYSSAESTANITEAAWMAAAAEFLRTHELSETPLLPGVLVSWRHNPYDTEVQRTILSDSCMSEPEYWSYGAFSPSVERNFYEIYGNTLSDNDTAAGTLSSQTAGESCCDGKGDISRESHECVKLDKQTTKGHPPPSVSSGGGNTENNAPSGFGHGLTQCTEQLRIIPAMADVAMQNSFETKGENGEQQIKSSVGLLGNDQEGGADKPQYAQALNWRNEDLGTDKSNNEEEVIVPRAYGNQLFEGDESWKSLQATQLAQITSWEQLSTTELIAHLREFHANMLLFPEHNGGVTSLFNDVLEVQHLSLQLNQHIGLDWGKKRFPSSVINRLQYEENRYRTLQGRGISAASSYGRKRTSFPSCRLSDVQYFYVVEVNISHFAPPADDGETRYQFSVFSDMNTELFPYPDSESPYKAAPYRHRYAFSCSENFFESGTMVVFDGDLGVEMGRVVEVVPKGKEDQLLQKYAVNTNEQKTYTGGYHSNGGGKSTLFLKSFVYRCASRVEIDYYFQTLPLLNAGVNMLLNRLKMDCNAYLFTTCDIKAMDFVFCSFQADGKKLTLDYCNKRPVRFLELSTRLFQWFHCRVWLTEATEEEPAQPICRDISSPTPTPFVACDAAHPTTPPKPSGTPEMTERQHNDQSNTNDQRKSLGVSDSSRNSPKLSEAAVSHNANSIICQGLTPTPSSHHSPSLPSTSPTSSLTFSSLKELAQVVSIAKQSDASAPVPMGSKKTEEPPTASSSAHYDGVVASSTRNCRSDSEYLSRLLREHSLKSAYGAGEHAAINKAARYELNEEKKKSIGDSTQENLNGGTGEFESDLVFNGMAYSVEDLIEMGSNLHKVLKQSCDPQRKPLDGDLVRATWREKKVLAREYFRDVHLAQEAAILLGHRTDFNPPLYRENIDLEGPMNTVVFPNLYRMETTPFINTYSPSSGSFNPVLRIGQQLETKEVMYTEDSFYLELKRRNGDNTRRKDIHTDLLSTNNLPPLLVSRINFFLVLQRCGSCSAHWKPTSFSCVTTNRTNIDPQSDCPLSSLLYGCSKHKYEKGEVVIMDGDRGVEMGEVLWCVSKEEFEYWEKNPLSESERNSDRVAEGRKSYETLLLRKLPANVTRLFLRSFVYRKAFSSEISMLRTHAPKICAVVMALLRKLRESPLRRASNIDENAMENESNMTKNRNLGSCVPSFVECDIAAMEFTSVYLQSDGRKLNIEFYSHKPVRFLELATFLYQVFHVRVWVSQIPCPACGFRD